ncbi:MAG TPA: MarR family transcriptional regulator [Clostridia bacterium]|nr:MarR family transcriptional regulator [Clostridia bacterium]
MNTDLKREFLHAMMRFRRAGMPMPPGGNIRMGEFFVLSRIPDEGASLTEIQNDMFMTKSAVSQLLSDLEKRRLVRREIDPDDRRRIAVTLTGEGDCFLHRQRRYADRVLDRTIERFGEANMAELVRLLKRLADVSEEIRQEVENQSFLDDDMEGEKPLD